MPVGESKIKKTDVRIIAATNKDLSDLVEEGRFRQDLYYRLNTVSIELPSLNERVEDIALLVERFALEFTRNNDMVYRGFVPDAIKYMKNHQWKGNIRELKNFVESIIVLEKGERITGEMAEAQLGKKQVANKKNDALQPSETKLTSAVKLSQGQKAARKPYNFVIVDYMNVVEGQEDNYLKAEAVWLKVHQDLAEQGRILGWGLAKARENKLGIEFITWKIVHSREDVVDLYNMDKFKKLLSEVDFKTLQELTGSSRSISGSEVLSLTDYTFPQEGSSFGELDPAVLAFNWNFMTPTSGREAEYLDVEQRYAQPWSQAKTDLDPRFIGWDLQEVVSAQGQTHPSKIRTVDALRKDQKLSNPDRLAINNKINNLGIWPQNINVGALSLIHI